MDEVFIPIIVVVTLFIGLPWLVFHYITRWKTAARLTGSDEKLLDDLYDSARRLDDRLCSIERIMTAENPEWRQNCLPGGGSRESSLLQNIDSLTSRTDRLLKDRK
ncbi:MAG: envelope stress response membrane protein PspB [Sphingomonas bacterium]|nr:envelope stress response membrane protein PspB [Sphingomonas bacterium]